MAESAQTKNIRDYYNKTAKAWADKLYEDDETSAVLTTFFKMLPEKPRILDLCCGTGCEAMRMSTMGAKVVGLDFSEASVEIAREHNPDIPFIISDMLEDYSRIGEVDAVVCVAGIVHLREDQLRKAFERMAQVVKPDGLVLLVFRDGNGRVDRMSDVEVDGEAYDRAFYAHNLEEIIAQSAGMFEFECLIDEPEPTIWLNAVLRRL